MGVFRTWILRFPAARFPLEGDGASGLTPSAGPGLGVDPAALPSDGKGTQTAGQPSQAEINHRVPEERHRRAPSHRAATPAPPPSHSAPRAARRQPRLLPATQPMAARPRRTTFPRMPQGARRVPLCRKVSRRAAGGWLAAGPCPERSRREPRRAQSGPMGGGR